MKLENQHPHLTEAEVQQRLNEIEFSSGQKRRDLMTELAWRPAWAIRSRRGSLAVLRSCWTDFLLKRQRP